MSDRDHNPEKAVNGIISNLSGSLPAKLDELDTAYDDDLSPLDDVVAWYRAPLRQYPKYPVQIVACSDSDVPGEYRKYGIHEHQIFVETVVRARRTASYEGVTLQPSEVASLLAQRYAEATELVLEANPKLTVSGTVQVSYAKVLRIAYSATRGAPDDAEAFEKRCALLLHVTSTPT